MIPDPDTLRTLDALEDAIMRATEEADEARWDHAHTPGETQRAAWQNALCSLDDCRRTVRPLLPTLEDLLLGDNESLAGRAHWLRAEALRAPIDPALSTSIRELETQIDRERRIFPFQRNEEDVPVGTLERALAASNDPEERQALWHARMALGTAIAPLVLRLAALRGRAAREAGFPSARSLALHLIGYTEEEVDAAADRVEKLSREKFRSQRRIDEARAAHRLELSSHDVRLWHSDHPFGSGLNAEDARRANEPLAECDAVDTVTRFFDSLGLDIRPIHVAASSEGPLPAVSRGWATSDDTGVSGRFDAGVTGIRRLMDAVSDAILFRYPGKNLREAQKVPTHPLGGLVLGRLATTSVRHASFYMDFSVLPRTEAIGRGPELQRIQSWERILYARSTLAALQIERTLASWHEENDVSDAALDELDATWQDAVSDCLGLSCEGASARWWWAALPGIESSAAFASSPLIAELLACAFAHRVRDQSGQRSLLDNPWAGELVLQLFAAHGSTRRPRALWEQSLQVQGLPTGPWNREITGSF